MTDSVLHYFLGFFLMLVIGISIFLYRSYERFEGEILRFMASVKRFKVYERSYFGRFIFGTVLLKDLERISGTMASDALAINSQQRQMTQILDQIEEGILLLDYQGRFKYLNSAAYRILGVSPTSLLPVAISECVRDLKLREFFVQFARSPETFQESEFSIQGDVKVALRISSVLGDLGDFEGAIVLLNDVSRIRLLEKHRREFVSNVSHEMKTPLTLIKGSVETLEEDEGFSERQRYLISLIKHNSDNLVESIEALLILSRLDESGFHLPLEFLRIKEQLKKLVVEFSARAEKKNVQLRLAECPEDLLLEGSGPLLAKALGNLIDNAIKHNEANTLVEIGARRLKEQIQIFVRDNGRGLPEEELPRIFERFYRPKSQSFHEGSGLGLSLVKNIAKAHKGDVTVSSRLGESSEFVLTLPSRAN